MRGVVAGAGGSERGPLQPTVGGVQPAHDRIEPEQLGVDDEGEADVEVGLVLFQARPLLHELDEVAAVDLDHVVHRDAWHTER